ncbi:monoxygenase [Burkholderia pseudomallei]|nr:monoxygenase [Burkholderia pseudomallei]
MTNKKILLNAFDMNCVGHINHGLWTHPRDRSAQYTDLDYWSDLARTLERGKFDAIFLADIVGVYDVYGGGPDLALRESVQVPVNDPLLLVPAMAQVTKHLGFGVTANLTYEPPYLFARRMSTLDHLTKGRIGWNIVTGYLDSAARGMGLARQIGHDDRYARADDYMEVVYQLWERSWDDDAVIRDRAARVFARPDKVRRVRHDGPYYSVDAIHLSEPSPQRTPVLYQAGASARGVEFAAKHAECVFVNGQSKAAARSAVADIRAAAARIGRDPASIKVFAGITVVTDENERAAREKFDEYRRPRESGGGPRALRELDRHRFLALRPRRADRAREDRFDSVGRRRDLEEERVRRMDRAAHARSDVDRRPLSAGGRLAVASGGRACRMGRRNGCRRLQRDAHGRARVVRRFRRPGGARVAGSRPLQGGLRSRADAAREAVRRGRAAA